MADFIKWIDGRSKLVKILFCLPVIDIIWGVYRLLLAIKDKNWARLVLAIIWIVIAGYLGWLLDLVCIILTGISSGLETNEKSRFIGFIFILEVFYEIEIKIYSIINIRRCYRFIR